MCRKALLTALVITYLLCVLLLSGVQKDDLDENALRKLERHNINIDDFNNEARRADCAESRKRKNSTSNTTLLPQVVFEDKNHFQDHDEKWKTITPATKQSMDSDNIATYLQPNNLPKNNDTTPELQTTKPEGQQTKTPSKFFDIYSKIKGETIGEPIKKFNRSEFINQRLEEFETPQLHNSYKHRNKQVGKTNDVFLTRSNEMETIEKYFAKKYLSKFKDEFTQRTPKRQNVKRGKDFSNKMLLRYLDDEKIGEDIDMYSDSAFRDNSKQDKTEITERIPLHEIFIGDVLAKTIDPTLYETTTQNSLSKDSDLMKEIKEEILSDLKKKYKLETLTTTSKPKPAVVLYEHKTSTHKTKEQIIDEFKETIVQDLKREFNFSLWTATTVTPVVPTTTIATTIKTTISAEKATTTTTTEAPKEDIVNKLKIQILNDLRDEIRKATSTKTPFTTVETTTVKSEQDIIKAVKDIVMMDLMKALMIQITTPPSTSTTTSTEAKLLKSTSMPKTIETTTKKPNRVKYGNHALKTILAEKNKGKKIERTTVRTTFIVSEISNENSNGENDSPAPQAVDLTPSVEIEAPKPLKDLKDTQANKVIEKFFELFKQLKTINEPEPAPTKATIKITKTKSYVAEAFVKQTPKPVINIKTTTETTTTKENKRHFSIIPIANTEKPFVELDLEPAYDYNIQKTNDNDLNINLGGPMKISDNPLHYSMNSDMAPVTRAIDEKTMGNMPSLLENVNNNQKYPYNIPQHYNQPNVGSPVRLPNPYPMANPMNIPPQQYLRNVPRQDHNPDMLSHDYVRYNGMASPYIDYNDASKIYMSQQTNLARPYTNEAMRSPNTFSKNAPIPFQYTKNTRIQKARNFGNTLSKLTEVDEIQSPSIPVFQSQLRPRHVAPHIMQTNSDEIAPLGIPIQIKNKQHLQKVIQNQNIIVTTPRYTYSKEDEIYKQFIAKHNTRSNRYRSYSPKQVKHRGRDRRPKHKPHYLTYRDFENASNNGDDDRFHKEERDISKRLSESDDRQRYDYKDFEIPHGKRHNIRSHQQREYKRKDRTLRDRIGREPKETVERENISPRYQMKIKHRAIKYDDTHFKDFLKTQEKVNEMLEKLLAPNKTR